MTEAQTTEITIQRILKGNKPLTNMSSDNASVSSMHENPQQSSQYNAGDIDQASYDLQEGLSSPSSALLSNQSVELLQAVTTKPPRTLKYLDCLAIVIGLQIGSGIFSAPAVVSSHVSSSLLGFLVWVLAGGLVWTGAASFIELGTSVPKNGGIQEYLRHCYGDSYGFLFAWVWIMVAKPCSMAMISLIFSEYFYKSILPDTNVSVWLLKATAIVGIAAITGLNCIGTRTGTKTANTFMVIKLIGLGSIPLAAILYHIVAPTDGDIAQQPIEFVVHNKTEPNGSSMDVLSLVRTSLKDLADATFAALFSYGGWESV
jgi:L-type amino acid transporter 6